MIACSGIVPWRNAMMFILSMNYTEQGIRTIKDAPKRAEIAYNIAKKLGVDVKQVYLTTGESDLIAILDAKDDDKIAKFAFALSLQGNVRTRTARAWSLEQYHKLVSELP
jgi:uncharacterized protein with GYD domain